MHELDDSRKSYYHIKSIFAKQLFRQNQEQKETTNQIKSPGKGSIDGDRSIW